MSQTPASHLSLKNLTQWLNYIETIHGVEIDLGLARMAEVAKRLAINFDFCQVISVAGTNGKGTSCAFIENALLGEHKSVAVYSSPHIERLNERLRFNKKDIDDQSLIAAFDQIEALRGEISLSFYEYTTLAAFLILQQVRPDVIILEVGLGGRLDATNIIDADIAVITTISLDHQAFLGNDREAIGFEKAGIMRRAGLVVVGDSEPPQSLLTHAQSLDVSMQVRNRDFFIDQHAQQAHPDQQIHPDQQTHPDQQQNWQWRCGEQSIAGLQQPHIPRDNVATALTVLSLLGVALNREKVNQLIAKTRVAGRTELLNLGSQTDCDILLDVGHNPQASAYLAQQIPAQKYQRVLAVVGMLADKDVANTLLPLCGRVDHWYLGTLDAPRAASAQQMALGLSQSLAQVQAHSQAKRQPQTHSQVKRQTQAHSQVKRQTQAHSQVKRQTQAQLSPEQMFNCFDNVTEAFKIASKDAAGQDLILVFGSFYTVAAIRRLIL